jgi:hypothetical protein
VAAQVMSFEEQAQAVEELVVVRHAPLQTRPSHGRHLQQQPMP